MAASDRGGNEAAALGVGNVPGTEGLAAELPPAGRLPCLPGVGYMPPLTQGELFFEKGRKRGFNQARDRMDRHAGLPCTAGLPE